MDNDNETIGERLRRARKKAGLTQKQLAEKSGVTQVTISHLETGITNKTSQAYELASALGVRTDWLLTGQGPMYPGQGDLVLRKHRITEVREPTADYDSIRKVNIRPNAGITGYAIEVCEEEGRPLYFPAGWLEEKGYKPQDLVALRVNGRSMEPSLHDGDMIVIDTSDTEPREGDVYVLNMEGEIVVKRLRKIRGMWIATSDNPDKTRYPDKPIDNEFTRIIGRVVFKESEVI